MKIKQKQIKINKKILEFYLLKLRTYEQNLNQNTIQTFQVYQTLIYLKKILKILFLFHKKNKKILFLGSNNSKFSRKINKKTEHFSITNNIKMRTTIFNELKPNKDFKYSLLKLKKKPHLIVVLNNTDNYSILMNESFNLKIPIIILNQSSFSKENKLIYHDSANFEFLIENTTFFLKCLKFLFKKPDQFKKLKLIVVKRKRKHLFKKSAQFKKPFKNFYAKYKKKKI